MPSSIYERWRNRNKSAIMGDYDAAAIERVESGDIDSVDDDCDALDVLVDDANYHIATTAARRSMRRKWLCRFACVSSLLVVGAVMAFGGLAWMARSIEAMRNYSQPTSSSAGTASDQEMHAPQGLAERCAEESLNTSDGLADCSDLCRVASCCHDKDHEANCYVEFRSLCDEYHPCKTLHDGGLWPTPGNNVDDDDATDDKMPSEQTVPAPPINLPSICSTKKDPENDLAQCEMACLEAECCWSPEPSDSCYLANRDRCRTFYYSCKVVLADDGDDEVDDDAAMEEEDEEFVDMEEGDEELREQISEFCGGDGTDPDLLTRCRDVCSDGECCFGVGGVASCRNVRGGEFCDMYNECGDVFLGDEGSGAVPGGGGGGNHLPFEEEVDEEDEDEDVGAGGGGTYYGHNDGPDEDLDGIYDIISRYCVRSDIESVAKCEGACVTGACCFEEGRGGCSLESWCEDFAKCQVLYDEGEWDSLGMGGEDDDDLEVTHDEEMMGGNNNQQQGPPPGTQVGGGGSGNNGNGNDGVVGPPDEHEGLVALVREFCPQSDRTSVLTCANACAEARCCFRDSDGVENSCAVERWCTEYFECEVLYVTDEDDDEIDAMNEAGTDGAGAEDDDEVENGGEELVALVDEFCPQTMNQDMVKCANACVTGRCCFEKGAVNCASESFCPDYAPCVVLFEMGEDEEDDDVIRNPNPYDDTEGAGVEQGGDEPEELVALVNEFCPRSMNQDMARCADACVTARFCFEDGDFSVATERWCTDFHECEVLFVDAEDEDEVLREEVMEMEEEEEEAEEEEEEAEEIIEGLFELVNAYCVSDKPGDLAKCGEACTPGACCFQRGSGGCATNDFCADFEKCQVLYGGGDGDGDNARDQDQEALQQQGEPNTLGEEIAYSCNDRDLNSPSDREECMDVCAKSACCFIAGEFSCSDQGWCEEYSGCSPLFEEGTTLAQVAVAEASCEPGQESTNPELCLEICDTRACCFFEEEDSCYDDNVAWCTEFDVCRNFIEA